MMIIFGNVRLNKGFVVGVGLVICIIQCKIVSGENF